MVYSRKFVPPKFFKNIFSQKNCFLFIVLVIKIFQNHVESSFLYYPLSKYLLRPPSLNISQYFGLEKDSAPKVCNKL